MTNKSPLTDLWVIVELSLRAEGEDPDVIKRVIAHIIRGAEVFIPAVVTKVGKDRVVHYLVDGYAFIRKDRPSEVYKKLEGSTYVHSMLYHKAKGDLATVNTAEINRLRMLVLDAADQGIGVGDTVTITAGPYKEIPAIVIEDMPELSMVQVYVKLLSKETILTLSRGSLRVESHIGRSPLYVRLQRFKTWLRQLTVVDSWKTSKADALAKAVVTSTQVTSWMQKGSPLYALVTTLEWDFTTFPLNDQFTRHQWANTRLLRLHLLEGAVTFLIKGVPYPKALAKAYKHWQHLDRQIHTFRALWHGIALLVRPTPVVQLPDALVKWQQLHNWVTCVAQVTTEIQQIRQTQKAKNTMVQNLIFDGFNLAFRCGYAPGMKDLKDTKGRPTGMILGFLRSIAAYKKRYPQAAMFICWDGSSAKRKALCPAYKANRPVRVVDGFDQVAFLRGLLPQLGITQVWHPEEEADDIIATLVRGTLASQQNLIVSTDRDFLQLVNSTTLLLAPNNGETLYDEDRVLADYGVMPEKMAHLRAFQGDTSDNLPGVPRGMHKVFVQLLNSYATVDGVLASSLPGITKLQYQKLRASENQVRLNFQLMTLRTNIQAITIIPNVDAQAVESQLQNVNIKFSTVSPFFSTLHGFIKV